MKSIEVSLSPELIHLHELSGKIVVVADILRATSCIVTALAHGIDHIIPFQNLEDCKEMKNEGYLVAGERNGKKVDGFDLGNSPFNYMDHALKGKKVAFTTTNGTQAFQKSIGAYSVLAGAFLNFNILTNYLMEANRGVVIFCAGWKGKFNLEDTLFAGAIVNTLKSKFNINDDSALAAEIIFLSAKDQIMAFLKNSSHFNRLKRLNITKDISFCLSYNKYEVIPCFKDNRIELLIN